MTDRSFQSLRPGSTGSARVAGRPWAAVLLSRWFLLISAAVLVAIALVAFTGRYSTGRRLSNLALSVEGIPDSYLMFSKSVESRGYLVDRRDSTVRRSGASFPGKRWNLERFGGAPGSAAPDHWLLRSKRAGTVFFVPVEEVPDLTYPFLYGFVRSEFEEYGLPWVTWTQLFVNRIYSGLYLRLDLPVDPRKKDGRTGLLRELLVVRGDRMSLVDTRFNRDGRLFAECISNGVFPKLAEPPPFVLWLARRNSQPQTTFLLSNAEPFEVALLPLPVSLDDLFQKLHGASLPATVDQRFRRWTAPVSSHPTATEPPFVEARLRRFERGIEKYRRSLGDALRNHLALHGSTVNPRMSALLEGASDEQAVPQ